MNASRTWRRHPLGRHFGVVQKLAKRLHREGRVNGSSAGFDFDYFGRVQRLDRTEVRHFDEFLANPDAEHQRPELDGAGLASITL